MIKFDQYELWQSIYKALNKAYTGYIYLIIESLNIQFDDCDSNEILGLQPICYTAKIRFGRDSSTKLPAFEDSLKITFSQDDGFEEITGIVLKQLDANLKE